MRSGPLWLPLPNSPKILDAPLHEVLAGWLGVELGPYNQLSDSLHVYDSDFEHIATDLFVDVQQSTDSLAFPREISERAFARLAQCIDIMLSPNLLPKELYNLIEYYDFPVAFQNMLLVIASEAARRKGWLDIAQNMMLTCSNPALIQVWKRWFGRVELQRISAGVSREQLNLN